MSVQEAKDQQVMRPTKRTLFMRSFLPWQLWRFLVINIRMVLMIRKSHGYRIERRSDS